MVDIEWFLRCDGWVACPVTQAIQSGWPKMCYYSCAPIPRRSTPASPCLTRRTPALTASYLIFWKKHSISRRRKNSTNWGDISRSPALKTPRCWSGIAAPRDANPGSTRRTMQRRRMYPIITCVLELVLCLSSFNALHRCGSTKEERAEPFSR